MYNYKFILGVIIMLFIYFQVANAPSVSRNKIGESTNDTDKELMAQLAKLKS